MGLIDTIKSLLGVEKSTEERAEGTSVTIEREPEEPAAAGTDATASTGSLIEEEAEEEPTEAAEPAEAAEGSESGEERTESVEDIEAEGAKTEGTGEVAEPIAEPTDASGSTESIVDEEGAAEEPVEAAEPAEAAGPESEDMKTEIEESEPEPEAAGEAEGTPVDEIKGIGPAYGERLAEVDVHTVEELVEADAEELAERTTVPKSRIRQWIDRAKEF